GKKVESRYYYIFYYHNGRLVRESSESESKMVAEKLLQQRMGEAGLGMAPAQQVANVKYEDVRDALLAEYKNQGKGTIYKRRDGTEGISGLTHLDKFFKRTPVTYITPDLLRRYIEVRRKEGAADATIRRNLGVLRSMLNLARKEGRLRLADVPHFPMPQDSKPRQGFVNPDVFTTLRDALPKNLHPLLTFIYFTGCRLGAARKITWAMVSDDCMEVELPGAITKSGEPLTLPLVGAGLDEVAKTLKKMPRKDGPVFDATNLRKAWNQACHKLGLGVYEKRLYKGLTIHDLRRSATRNLIRAGVSRGVAMQITGHKTEAIFERYNITDAADVRDALVKVGQYVKLGAT
ncbi:MAG: tyrosine-type recombinase/integrase, partial [Candidatus Acidiferrales bacterium]